MKAEETVVIFIEFQHEFCHPRGLFYPIVQQEMERIGTLDNAKRLLTAAREKGATVIHCPFTADEPWVRRNNISGLLAEIVSAKAFQPNTWGAAIIEEMEPLASETVLTGKHALSAFANTELNHILKRTSCRQLLLCGFLTNVCVQATAYSAYDRAFHPRIVVDACASGSREIQEYVETTICSVLGGPLTVEQVLAQLV